MELPLSGLVVEEDDRQGDVLELGDVAGLVVERQIAFARPRRAPRRGRPAQHLGARAARADRTNRRGEVGVVDALGFLEQVEAAGDVALRQQRPARTVRER